jgi:MYXO-CTERM domain-containing protein
LSAVNIATDAPVGRRDLNLSLPGGDRLIPEAFAVLQGGATLLVSISPDHADRGHPGLTLELSGENTHFDAQQVDLSFSGQGITATNEQAIDGTQLSAQVRIDTSAAEDARDMRVQVGGACDWMMPAPCESVELAAAFTVTTPGSLDSADPTELEADGDVDVSISATDGQFVTDITQLFFEPADGIEVLSINVTGPDQLLASLRLSADASGAARDVTAVTGTEVAFGQGLVDVHNPQIERITPAAGFQGTLVPVLIIGIDLPFSANSTVEIDGAGCTVAAVVFDPEWPDQITTEFTITDEAAPGNRQVTVVAGAVSATSVFTVMERPEPPKEGCGCAARPTGTAWFGLVFLALFGLRFRIAHRR